MKRWGYVKGDVNYKKIAEQVYTAASTRETMKAMSLKPPAHNSVTHTFALGKTRLFDPEQPEAYLKSFAIRKASA
jgi:nitrate/nitrite transport system substrate-binding protein